MAHWIWSSCVRRSCGDPHWAMSHKNSGEFSLSNLDRWTVETPKDPARILHLVCLSGFKHPKYLLEMQERILDTFCDLAGIERARRRIGLLSRLFGARECWDCAYEADGGGNGWDAYGTAPPHQLPNSNSPAESLWWKQLRDTAIRAKGKTPRYNKRSVWEGAPCAKSALEYSIYKALYKAIDRKVLVKSFNWEDRSCREPSRKVFFFEFPQVIFLFAKVGYYELMNRIL